MAWSDEEIKKLAKALSKEFGQGCPVFTKKQILTLKVMAIGGAIFAGGLLLGYAAYLINRL